MATGFAIAFPFLFIIIYLLRKPKNDYMYRHYANDKVAVDEIEGYDMICDEIDGFAQYHNDGFGFHCHQLGKIKYVDIKNQVFPIDKREFLESNPNAAKLYKKCMVRHIAWSRGVVPYSIRRAYKKLDPYKPYYSKYGAMEKEFYSHGKTQYECNCIKNRNERRDEYCRHCVYTQNKIAKSYLAQRLVNYKQGNLTTYFGTGAYAYPAHDRSSFSVNNKSCEGLSVAKWNCADRSNFDKVSYNGYEQIEKLKISSTDSIECANGTRYLNKCECNLCDGQYNCFAYGLNKDFEF